MLEKSYGEDRSSFVVIYGRRRVGKTYLLKKFCINKKHFLFTGSKMESKIELFSRFMAELSKFLSVPYIANVKINDWKDVFDIIDANIKEKLIIIMDEFQWLCPKGFRLMSALQEYWDDKWKHNSKVFLVLCGSIISFIEKKVLSEKSPLYGRRTLSFEVEPMSADSARLFLPKRNFLEQTQAIMTFGGIPSYLEQISTSESLAQNINRLALRKDGYFINEIQYVLREQLRFHQRYYALLEALSEKSSSRQELAEKMGISNSGALNLYLKNLSDLHLIKGDSPISKEDTGKQIRYSIYDEFLRFYFTFIKPNMQQIQMNMDDWLYDNVIAPRWDNYCGYSFELFCKKNIRSIISILEIKKVFKRCGDFWQRKTSKKQGIQIDLIIERTDGITHIGECKWSSGKIGLPIVEELQRKKELYPNPKNHTLKILLITTHGVTDQVEKSGGIDNVITVKEMFSLSVFLGQYIKPELILKI